MSITATERTQIVELTTLMFDAAPGATYLSEIVSMFEANGHSLSALANSLAATGAFAAVYPNSLTDAEFASQFLSTVGLQNDTFAKDWITSKLASGMSKGQVAYAAFNALNGVSTTDAAQYQAAKAMLLNKTAVAEFYSEPAPVGIDATATDLSVLQGVVAPVTADPATVAATKAALSAAQTFVLTTAVDNATAGHFVGSLAPYFFDGTGPTLNVGDTLTGANTAPGANNTLLVADAYGSAADIMPVGVTLNNIQSVTLNTAGNAGNSGPGGVGGGAFDTSPFASVVHTTVTSSGGGTDTVQASSSSSIDVTHNAVNGGVNTLGGQNVTVTTNGNGTVAVGAYNAGSSQVLPTGAVVVNDNSLTGPGAGNTMVSVIGGTSVSVSVSKKTASGNIEIGNTTNNGGTGAATAASNPTGAISVTSNSTVGSSNVDNIFGGTSVTVNVQGDTVVVGDSAATTPSNQPSGDVVVNNQQPTTYDNLTGTGHTTNEGGSIEVYGGANVTVASNTGNSIVVGNYDNVTYAGIAGTMPSGNVNVTQTGADLNGAFGMGNGNDNWTEVTGGVNVSVTSAGGDVWVGSFDSTNQVGDPSGAVTVTETRSSHHGVAVEGGTSVTVSAMGQEVWVGDENAPSGAVVVNQSSVYTGVSYNDVAGVYDANTDVTVDGGTSVTINTTGGNVYVGAGSTNADAVVPSGDVNITNTFSGAGSANHASVSVLGGAAVNITVKNTTDGSISVGAAAQPDITGTMVGNSALDPTGNVTIMNAVTNGSTTTYGTSFTTVRMNGGTTASITGGTVAAIVDVNQLAQTLGANAGKPVGASSLTTVILDGVHSAGLGTIIDSGALANLTIADSPSWMPTMVQTTTDPSYGLVNEGAHTLNLTLSNDAAGTSLNDGTATAVTVGTTGTKASTIALNLANATTATFNNAAAVTVGLSAAADPKLATITANNSGSLNLGDLSGMGAKLTAINAATATGAITVQINPEKTAFNGTGSSGAETVAITSNTITLGVHGGTNAGNILDANYAARAASPTYVGDTPLGTNAKVSGFSTLEVAGANAGTVAHGLNHTYQGPVAAVPAVQQVDTVSIGGTVVAGDVFSETISVNGGAPNTYSYTATATDTPATVAANLAAAIVAGGNSGLQVQYTSGTTFTLTAPVAATTFTASSSVNTAGGTGPAPTVTPTNAAAATAQVDQITFSGVATGADNIGVTVNSSAYSTPVFVNETADQVAAALAATINNDSTAVVTAAASAGGVLTLTAKVANTPFTDTVVDTGISNITATGPTTTTSPAPAGYETVTEAFTGAYLVGNVITESINGHIVSYTVTGPDAASDVTLATNLANAINSAAVGATAATGGTSTVTVTNNAAGQTMNLTVSVANAATPATEGTVVTTVGNPGSPAIAGDGVYDATNFTALMVGATNAATPDVIFTNVATGTPLTFVANQAAGGVTDYILKDATGTSDTLPLTVGVDGSTTGLNVTVQTTGVENIALNSVGKSGTNSVLISDPAASTLTITGDSATTVTMWDAGIKSIDASGSSGAVDVTNVILSTEWTGGTHTITGGTGALTAKGGTNVNDVDTITTGSGGGTITIGKGGAWGTQSVLGYWGYSAGSETINLGVPAGTATNTLVVPDGVVSTFNSSKGGVTGFDMTVNSPDRMTFAEAKSAVVNVTAPTVVNTLAGSGWATFTGLWNLDPTGTEFSKLGNLAYTSSNGVLTFSATGAHTMSDFTASDLIAAAEVIVNTQGASQFAVAGNQIAMFTYGGNTYVVSSDPGATLATNGNWQLSDRDSVVELLGNSSPSGFGYIPAAGTVVTPTTANLNFVAAPALTNSGTAAAAVYNAAGYSQLNDFGSFAEGTTSTVINNLAPSSWLALGSLTGTLTTNQTASAGNNSIGFSLGGTDNGAITVNGDALAYLKANGDVTITKLTDGGASATLAKLMITQDVAGHTLDVKAISDSALTTIDASGFSGNLTLGDGTALSQANLTIKLDGGTAHVFTSGAGDTITDSNGAVTLTASGANNVIKMTGSGVDTIVANGNGDQITLGTAGGTITANGTGDTFTFVDNTTGPVTLQGITGTTLTGIHAGNTVAFSANTTFEQDVSLQGAVTGGTSANYAATTISAVTYDAAKDVLWFDNAATETFIGQVNVSSATTLAQALDLAANVASMSQQSDTTGAAGTLHANNGVIDWFQFGGNTYIVEAVNPSNSPATNAALDANDVVVKIVGLYDLGPNNTVGVTDHVHL